MKPVILDLGTAEGSGECRDLFRNADEVAAIQSWFQVAPAQAIARPGQGKAERAPSAPYPLSIRE